MAAQEVGIRHMLHHDSLLGSGRRSASQRRAAVATADAGGGDETALAALASLAVWEGVCVLSMAQRLLDMTTAQRAGLRCCYAEDASNPA